MNAADWCERDVVPLSSAVREANQRNKVVPRACPLGSTWLFSFVGRRLKEIYQVWFSSIFDGLVKSPLSVMPDLIRHPELIEFTGF
jgi:hypothetical protein